MARDSCLTRVTTGAALGGAIGGAVGAVYGTYEAVRYKVPGLLKIRHIGQTTLGSAAVFGLFLGAGSLIHCGRKIEYYWGSRYLAGFFLGRVVVGIYLLYFPS